MFKQTLFLLAALLTVPVWAVNKCTGADGKVSFQDAPCSGGKAETLRIQSSADSSTSKTAAGEAQARLEKMQRDNVMAEAVRVHKPLVGMTISQLQQAMGVATKVNADNYNGTRREQVIYERAQETWFVYTRNGVVDSIQHRPGAPIGVSPPDAAGTCPTRHEIKNAITSASSISLSEGERVERWKAIRAMQACK